MNRKNLKRISGVLATAMVVSSLSVTAAFAEPSDGAPAVALSKNLPTLEFGDTEATPAILRSGHIDSRDFSSTPHGMLLQYQDGGIQNVTLVLTQNYNTMNDLVAHLNTQIIDQNANLIATAEGAMEFNVATTAVGETAVLYFSSILQPGFEDLPMYSGDPIFTHDARGTEGGMNIRSFSVQDEDGDIADFTFDEPFEDMAHLVEILNNEMDAAEVDIEASVSNSSRFFLTSDIIGKNSTIALNGPDVDYFFDGPIFYGQATNQERVDDTVLALTDSYTNYYELDWILHDMYLPISNEVFGADIEWSSSNPEVVSNTGVIARGLTDGTATLTATVTRGDAQSVYTIDVVVKNSSVEYIDHPLQSLNVGGYQLSPVFDPRVNTYNITVPYNTSRVLVQAAAQSPWNNIVINAPYDSGNNDDDSDDDDNGGDSGDVINGPFDIDTPELVDKEVELTSTTTVIPVHVVHDYAPRMGGISIMASSSHSTYTITVTKGDAPQVYVPPTTTPTTPTTQFTDATKTLIAQYGTAVKVANTEQVKNADGQTVTKVKKDQPFTGTGDVKAVVVPVSITNGSGIASFTPGFLAELRAKDETSKVVLQGAGVTYEMPSTFADTSAVVKSLDLSEDVAKDAEIQVSITAVDAPNAPTGLIIGPVVNFTITLITPTATYEYNEFRGTYIQRSFELIKKVDSSEAVGVLINDDGTMTPVPTVFTEIDGQPVAVAKVDHNSKYTVIENTTELSDIANSFAKDDIQALANKLIIAGYEDGTFKPSNDVTRAQFATMIVKGLGMQVDVPSADYTDVAAGAWYEAVVNAMNDYGFIKGYEDGSFKPNKTITREEQAVILNRVLTYLGKTVEGEKQFKDAAEISAFAKIAVNNLAVFGVINGYNGEFNPKDQATRAETATMISNFLEKVEFKN